MMHVQACTWVRDVLCIVTCCIGRCAVCDDGNCVLWHGQGLTIGCCWRTRSSAVFQQAVAYTVLCLCRVQELQVSICVTPCPGPEACGAMCRKRFRRFDYFTVSLSPERAINFTTNPGNGYLILQVGFPPIPCSIQSSGMQCLEVFPAVTREGIQLHHQSWHRAPTSQVGSSNI